MRIIYLIILVLSGLLLPKVSMSNPNQTCLTSEPGDSVSFGFSVAINNKYLAVGDPTANHVAIYIRDSQGKWFRSKEIVSPVDSIPDKIGRGFGRDLQLDEDVLVINALTSQNTKDVTNPEDFQVRGILNSLFYGRYLIRLNSETEVKAIDLPMKKKQGLVQFNLLSEGKIKQVTLPDNGEIAFGEDTGLGYNFAFDNNLLLVGSPAYPQGGGAWLFDLNRSENKPLQLTIPDAYIGATVALNDQFAVVSDLLGETINDPKLPPKTLIRSLSNGSTTVIDSYGELSLSGNILAVMRFRSEDGEQAALLEVFRLDNDAKPHLIIKRGHPIKRAWVQNNFLVTVQHHYFFDGRSSKYVQLCLESVH